LTYRWKQVSEASGAEKSWRKGWPRRTDSLTRGALTTPRGQAQTSSLQGCLRPWTTGKPTAKSSAAHCTQTGPQASRTLASGIPTVLADILTLLILNNTVP